LPQLVEAQAMQRVTTAADAAHETTSESLSEAFGVHPSDVDRYERDMEERVKQSTNEIAADVSDRALALALGFETRVRVGPLLKGLGLAAAVTLVWHFIHGKRPEAVCYWLIVGLAALVMTTRTAQIYERWRRTADEQCLLKLAPRWPSESNAKRLFLRSTGWAQLSGWLAWVFVTPLALLLQAVTVEQAVLAAVVLMAASSGAAASFGLLLARQSLKEWHMSTVIVLLSVIVGTVGFALGVRANPYAAIVAIVMVLAPSVFALAAVALRPLQFPVSPVAPK
jgi:hypothetical protein